MKTKTKTKTKKRISGCLRQTAKKYKTRSSPPFSASDCPNQTKPGNDGKKWVSNSDKRGIYRWTLVSEKPASLPLKKYVTHYNGDLPFVVYDHGNKVTLFPQKYNEVTDDYDTVWTKPKEIPYRRLWKGEQGSAVLLETGVGQYTLVSGIIKTFSTPNKDIIHRFSSPIGNSDVPYPTAVGDKFVYFLLDDKYVPKEVMPSLKDDLYTQFYGQGKYKDTQVASHAKKL